MSFEDEFRGIVSLEIGETFCCVGFWNEQRKDVEIVCDEFGNRLIPSYVAFREGKILVGEIARRQARTNPKNTVYGFRRYLGRRFDDDVVQKDLNEVPFRIVEQEGKPVIELSSYKTKNKTRFTVKELMVILVKYLKSITEKYTGKKVTRAIMTVPPSHNDSQRRLTKDCGQEAMIENVVRIINEPTACCVAYGLGDRREMNLECVLVFDFGGRRLDVSILEIEDGIYEIMSHIEDFSIGGEMITRSLFDLLCENIEKKYQVNLKNDIESVSKLLEASESAKKKLSTEHRTTISIDKLFNDVDYTYQISRSKFESLLPLRKCLQVIRKAIEESSTDIRKLRNIVFSGGSSKIPRIQKVVSEYFEGVEVHNKIPFQEVVTYGASIQASRLCGPGKYYNLLIQDITALSIGVGVVRHDDDLLVVVMDTLIRRNTTFPVSVSRIYSLNSFPGVSKSEDGKVLEVTICIFEGERIKTSDNHLIGKVDLSEIPNNNKSDELRVSVTINIDYHGVIYVRAEVLESGISNEVVIMNEKGRLTKEEIEELVRNASQFLQQPKISREEIEFDELIQSKNELEMLLSRVKNILGKNNKSSMAGEKEGRELREGTINISEGVLEKLMNFVDENIRWFEELEGEKNTKKEVFVERKKLVESQLPSIILGMLKQEEKTATSPTFDDLDVD